jgi:hypothetical protein
MTDLLVRNAALVATCDAAGRELAGGWVAITDGAITDTFAEEFSYHIYKITP